MCVKVVRLMDSKFLSELGISEENASIILEKNNNEISLVKLNHHIEKELFKRGAKNIDAAIKLLDIGDVTFDEENIDGINELLDNFQKENDFLFETQKHPMFSSSIANNPSPSISREEFSKMGYKKRLSLYNENPELYNELTK